MIADVPTGAWAGRRLGTTLALSSWLLVLGLLLLGRVLAGLAHTLGTVGGLTALLQNDDGGSSASMRLNTFEFAGMLGVLGGLIVVSALPRSWPWNVSLLVTATPLLGALALTPTIRRRFRDQSRRSIDVDSALVPPPTSAGAEPRTDPIVSMMFVTGAVMALSWSSVSQFLIPLRGAREFGLDRAGVSRLLAMSQLVDLIALLPVGWLADRVGRVPVLALVLFIMGLGTFGTGIGSFPLFALGCALFGLGLAGWMLPLGVMREHTPLRRLAWRTGLYRLAADAAMCVGPVICGVLGEANTGMFIAAIGLAAVATGAALLRRAS